MGLITVLTDNKNHITKEILDKELNKSTPGHIVVGHGIAQDVDAEGLADLISGVTSKQCLCTGIVPEQGLDQYRISPKGAIQRTLKHFSYPDDLPGWLILDFDFAEGQQYLEPDDAIQLLSQHAPALTDCSKVLSYSSSAFLYDTETGVKLNSKDNYHIYIEVENGNDIEQIGSTLFKRLILDGYGHIMVVKNSGAQRVKSIIDPAVFTSGANREIFEADPICCSEVISKRKSEGGWEAGPQLTIDDVNILTPEDEIRLELTVAALKDTVEVRMETKRQRANGRRMRLAAKKGRSLINFDDWTDNSGTTHSALGFSEVIKCNSGNDFTLLEVYQDILNWKNKGIPDPINPWIRGIKGSKVGKDIARIRFDEDTGRPYIFSFHGSVEYDLVWDYDSLSELITNAKDGDELDAVIDDAWDPSLGVKTMLTDSEIVDLAEEVAAKAKELGVKSSVGTDARKAPKKLKKIIEKATNTAASVPSSTRSATSDVPAHITKMNSKMGMALYAGKTRVIGEEFNPTSKEWSPTFTSIRELKDLKINEKVSVQQGGEWVKVPVMEHWHEHEERNTYDRVVFRPTKDKFRGCGQVPVIQQGGEYNQWMGFLANLKNAKKCDKILWHLEHIWCSGNQEIYEYTLCWFAELFQNPGGVGQMFLVLKSLQGAGKNIIIDQVVGKLLGIHAITTGSKEDIIGRFNSHLGLNIFTFLDEAIFAGDPQSKNLMKSLINENRMVERKGVDKIKAKNMTKVIIATNEQYAANIDGSDRRHVYLPVSNSKCQDRQYFEELLMEIEDGGRESFLDFMLNKEITVDVRKMPGGQSSQRELDERRSAPAPVKFLYDLYENGVEQYDQPSGRMYSQSEFQHWMDMDVIVPKHILHELFNMYCRRAGIKTMHLDIQAMFQILGADGLYVNRKRPLVEREEGRLAEYGRERLIKVKRRGIYLED